MIKFSFEADLLFDKIDRYDISSVVKVLKSDWITTGPKSEEFESKFASFVGSKFAVCFSSGTAALHASVLASGASSGAEAILPT